MTTLLEEIIEGASGTMPLATLLRKCLTLVTRLKSQSAIEWIKWELGGYPQQGAELPDYRKLSLVIKANLIDLMMKADGWTVPPEYLGKDAQAWTSYDCRDGIAAIEHLIESNTPTIHLRMRNLHAFLVSKNITDMEIVSAWGELSSSRLKHILDTVRTRVLEFALELEEMYPDASAVKSATPADSKAVDQIFINHIYGPANVVGTASQSNIVLNVTKGDFASLERVLSEQGISSSDIRTLKAALDAEPTPPAKGFGPRVAAWIGSIMKKTAEGALKAAGTEGVGLIMKAIGSYYGASG
jgi:hypothetical protein